MSSIDFIEKSLSKPAQVELRKFKAHLDEFQRSCMSSENTLTMMIVKRNDVLLAYIEKLTE